MSKIKMSKIKLLGVSGLAALLMAVPAYAQNAGGGGAGGGGNLNNPSSYSNGGNYGTNQGGPYANAGAGAGMAANGGGVGVGAGDNNASTGGGAGGNMGGNAGRAGNTGAVVGNGRYANVGFGSYTGEQFFIGNAGGNGGSSGGGGNGVGSGSNNTNNWRPSQRNPDLADNGDARASKVIGTAVYNSLNQKLGNVNDVLIGTNGVFAVIATNNKQVAVPFGDLMFGNATNQGNEKIVIPNETETRLNTLPVFHYNAANYPGVNANNFSNANFASGNSGGVFGNGSGGGVSSNLSAGPRTAGNNVGGIGADGGSGAGGGTGNR